MKQTNCSCEYLLVVTFACEQLDQLRLFCVRGSARFFSLDGLQEFSDIHVGFLEKLLFCDFALKLTHQEVS